MKQTPCPKCGKVRWVAGGVSSLCMDCGKDGRAERKEAKKREGWIRVNGSWVQPSTYSVLVEHVCGGCSQGGPSKCGKCGADISKERDAGFIEGWRQKADELRKVGGNSRMIRLIENRFLRAKVKVTEKE